MSARSAVTIYHNPACGTSRNTVALIRDAGIEPQIVQYLKTPPDLVALTALAAAMDGGARERLRAKEALATELGLLDESVGDATLLDAIAAHPILLNRPVVVSAKGARACRPAERVLDLL